MSFNKSIYQVTLFRDHLRNAHKITEQEYEELFTDGSDYKTGKIQIKEEIENNFENGQESGYNLILKNYPYKIIQLVL